MVARDAIRAGAVARRPRGSRALLAQPIRPVATPRVRRERIAYLDNLKVMLVAVIIAGHSAFGYAAWRQWRQHHASPFATHARPAADHRAPLLWRTLVSLAAGISLATIMVRPAFPFGSGQIGQLHLWQWPTYLGMFGLGIVAVQRGWLDPVPDRVRRRCAQAVLVSLVAFGLIFAAASLGGISTNAQAPGLHLAPTVFAAIEGPIAVGICVWLLAFAQRHLSRTPGARGRALARAAFAAFLVQGPIITGLQVALP